MPTEIHAHASVKVWQLMQLVEKKKQMREKMKTLKSEEMHDYIEMDELLKTLHEIMEMVINSHLIRFFNEKLTKFLIIFS